MHTVQARGITISYEDAGTGPALLLIHGHPFDSSMWQPQLQALSATHRVLAPDLRGYGHTTVVPGVTPLDEFARDLFAFIGEVGVEEVILVGLSMGGQIAFAFTQLFPQCVRALVLADTFAQLDSPEGRAGRVATADRIVAEGMDRYAAELLPGMLAPATIQSSPAVVEHVVRMMRGTNPEGAAAALRGRAQRPDYVPLLQQITVPTFIVVGSDDAFTPVADAALMQRHIPGSVMTVIEGCGHMPNLERPDEFNRLVLDFLHEV